MIFFFLFSVILLAFVIINLVSTHGPPLERDNEDITMGRKVKKVRHFYNINIIKVSLM